MFSCEAVGTVPLHGSVVPWWEQCSRGRWWQTDQATKRYFSSTL